MRKAFCTLLLMFLSLACLATPAKKPPTFSKKILAKVRVWKHSHFDTSLLWSPNGKWAGYILAESREHPSDFERYSLCVVRRDGKVVKRFKTWAKSDPWIALWSPDSKSLLYWLLYPHTSSANADGSPLYEMRLDTEAHLLTTPAKQAKYPDDTDIMRTPGTILFSHNKRSLLLVRGGSRFMVDNKRLVKIDWKTRKTKWLTSPKMASCEPAWSPTDRQITYIACDDRLPLTGLAGDNVMDRIRRQHLWVMNSDEKQKRQLTSDPKYHESYPRWRSSNLIEFYRESSADDNAKSELWEIRADGTGLRKLRDLPPQKQE